ncbi:hypothetical protein [Herbidospora cretacea]|uniref:hypothetical protein n=1 Tax=Herbidospora cretacea TaxID=28444 RepID=UPI0012DF91D0|nr:hypothetical protein [Herbidospora cretacea]
MAIASFVGMSSWVDFAPRIELETPAGLLDLHNNAIIVSFGISVDPAEVVISFSYARDWKKIVPGRVNVRLVFSDVERLRIEQDADYHPQAGETLERIVHRVESGQSEFEIDAGDWQLRFNASRVAVESEIRDCWCSSFVGRLSLSGYRIDRLVHRMLRYAIDAEFPAGKFRHAGIRDYMSLLTRRMFLEARIPEIWKADPIERLAWLSFQEGNCRCKSTLEHICPSPMPAPVRFVCADAAGVAVDWTRGISSTTLHVA